MSDKMNNSLCWFDVYAEDCARAKAFYSELFGWRYREFEPGSDMWMIDHENDGVGGMLNRRQGPKPSGEGFVPYFQTKSIDETLARASKLGAKIVLPKTLINEKIGSFAVIEDTESNRVALYQNA